MFWRKLAAYITRKAGVPLIKHLLMYLFISVVSVTKSNNYHHHPYNVSVLVTVAMCINIWNMSLLPLETMMHFKLFIVSQVQYKFGIAWLLGNYTTPRIYMWYPNASHGCQSLTTSSRDAASGRFTTSSGILALSDSYMSLDTLYKWQFQYD